MNMFARFDENPVMTLQDIKKTNVMDGRTFARTHNVKTVYPPQTKFAGGIITHMKIKQWGATLNQYINATHMGCIWFNIFTCK